MAVQHPSQIFHSRSICFFLSTSSMPKSLCFLSSRFLGAVPSKVRRIQGHHRPLWQNVRSVCASSCELSLHRGSSSLTASLNEEQLLAVETDQPCVRVVAGPGSGKTRVLTERVAHLIAQHSVSPHNILFVTFTNKAAGEIRERLGQIFGSKILDQLTVGTFHSICAKILRRHSCCGVNTSFMIFDDDDCEKLVKNIINVAREALSGIYGPMVDHPMLSEMLSSDISNLKNLVDLSKYATPEKMSGHLGDLMMMGFLKEENAENMLVRECLNFREESEGNGWQTATVSSPSVRSLLKSIQLAREYELKSFLAEQAQKTAPLLPKSLRHSHCKMAVLYENALRRNNAVDFDDLIHLVVRAFHLQPHLREVSVVSRALEIHSGG